MEDNELDKILGETDEREQVKKNVGELLRNKEEYAPILLKIAEHEKEIDEDDRGWTWKDVGVQGQRLGHLVTKGILKVTYDSGNKTRYRVKNRLGLEKALNKYIEQQGAEEEGYKIPENIFEPIVNYPEVKKRFKRTLETQSVRQSILLVGPAASSKTLFLEEVARIKGTIRIPGKSVTGAGFENKILQRPNFIIIDEYDELESDVYSELLNYQDPKQPFEVVKAGKMDTIKAGEKAPIFASANSLSKPSEPNLDRFWKYRFKRYSDEEFEKICKRLLPREFGVSVDLAQYISTRLRNIGKDFTIRDAERLAEVVDNEEDVDEEIKVLNKYRV